MKRLTFSLISAVLFFLITVHFSQAGRAFNTGEINSIITHVTYSNCADYNWTVRVQKNGGGYDETCNIIQPGSCKCVVSGAPQGYYTITVNNGQCTAVKYNVYHAANSTNTDVYVNELLDCY